MTKRARLGLEAQELISPIQIRPRSWHRRELIGRAYSAPLVATEPAELRVVALLEHGRALDAVVPGAAAARHPDPAGERALALAEPLVDRRAGVGGRPGHHRERGGHGEHGEQEDEGAAHGAELCHGDPDHLKTPAVQEIVVSSWVARVSAT